MNNVSRKLFWATLMGVGAVLALSPVRGQSKSEPDASAKKPRTDLNRDAKSDKKRDFEPDSDPTALDAYDPEGGSGRRIVEIPIEGTIELGIAAFIERALSDARESTPRVGAAMPSSMRRVPPAPSSNNARSAPAL